MEFAKINLQDWEQLVKKQLKTEDIYQTLVKENLEGIVVKPYYDHNDITIQKLPKIEESTHLVAAYETTLEEDAYAFLISDNVKVAEKTLFFKDKNIISKLEFELSNQYISLVDVFDDKGKVDVDLAKKMLSQNNNRSIGVDISLHQNAGASIVQQLAIALAKTKDLVEAFGTEVLHRLTYRMAIGYQYFLEISKIRAFKYLFNQLSKEYGLNLFPYIFAETSLRNKSKNDAENNLIRSTLELSAAMIGGADAVYSNDYKMQNPTKLSQEISFKQMIVLAYESIINVFEDATSGSYMIEDITRQFSDNAWQLFLEIENQGGYTLSMEQGILQNQIFDQAIKEQSWVENGKIKLIGVNLYPKLEITKTLTDLYHHQEIKEIRWAEMFE